MPEQCLNITQVSTCFQQMAGKAVAAGMGRYLFLDPCFFYTGFEKLIDAIGGKIASGT